MRYISTIALSILGTFLATNLFAGCPSGGCAQQRRPCGQNYNYSNQGYYPTDFQNQNNQNMSGYNEMQPNNYSGYSNGYYDRSRNDYNRGNGYYNNNQNYYERDSYETNRYPRDMRNEESNAYYNRSMNDNSRYPSMRNDSYYRNNNMDYNNADKNQRNYSDTSTNYSTSTLNSEMPRTSTNTNANDMNANNTMRSSMQDRANSNSPVLPNDSMTR